MKKIILTAIIAIATLTGVNAQHYRWWVGGRTSLWNGEYKTSFTVAPEAGYQITPQLTAATSLALEAYRFAYEGNINSSTSVGLIFNPYMRYTFFKTGILMGFVDGGFEVGLGDYDGLQIGFKPGLAMILSNRFTAAFQFGFIGYNDGKDIGGRDKGFGFDLSGYRSAFAIFYSF